PQTASGSEQGVRRGLKNQRRAVEYRAAATDGRKPAPYGVGFGGDAVTRGFVAQTVVEVDEQVGVVVGLILRRGQGQVEGTVLGALKTRARKHGKILPSRLPSER